MISLNKHGISAKIKDRYAYIVYSFSFENNNKNATSNELRFEITIDPSAFISSFEADIDGELFHGITKEKQKAAKEYKAAKKKNENAILVSKPYDTIPNVFEIKTNIDSGSKILLNITIEQYLQKQFDFNQVNIQILHDLTKYFIKKNYEYIPFTLEVSDQSGIYDIDINANPGIIDVDKNMDKMNENCMIKGKILSTPSQSSLNELILKYKIKGEQNEAYVLYDNKTNTFCHVISNIMVDSVMNNNTTNNETEGNNDIIQKNDMLVPRRVIFCIDKSGSMRGLKWDKTISATVMALLKLRVGYDRFCVMLFNGSVEIYPNNGFILAESTSISDAVSYLQKQNAGGGTNINDSLLKGIELIKNDIKKEYDFFMNQMIFITDGEPNNGECDTKKILLNVENVNKLKDINKYNNSKISICSFGVGSDSNSSNWIKDLNHSFLKLLSLNNNGFYKRIKQTSADIALNDYFNILSRPIALNINIKYHNKNIKQLTNNCFNVLYSGNDLIICGKLSDKTAIDLNVSITAVTGIKKENDELIIVKPINIIKEMKINISDSNNENIERIWAYSKLQQLADEKLIIHTDMIELDDDEKKDNDSFAMSLAMKYQFVTPWTSMIVVKKKQDQKQDEQQDEKQEEEKQEDNDQKEEKQQQQRVWGYTMNRNDASAFRGFAHFAQQQQQQQQPQSQSSVYDSNEHKSINVNNDERNFYKSYWIEAGKIGEGAFSKVRTITRKSDKKKFDLKMIKKKGKSEQQIKAGMMEIQVLTKCNHENIVELETSVDTKKRMYIVVELCNGGDIVERVIQYKKWSEQRTVNIIKQIVCGLDHLHDLGFVHRDLKPENLMYLSKDINSIIKIAEFEFVGKCDENNGLCKDICSGITANYASPEIILSSEHNQLSDLWSLGVLIYILLCGFPPFFDEKNNTKKLYEQIINCKYSFPSPFWDNISNNAKDLISKLLVKDVKNRLNAKQVLKHDWLKNADVDQKNDSVFGNEYVKQMSHWNSIRSYTEFEIGNDVPPVNESINLYYNPPQKQSENNDTNTT